MGDITRVIKSHVTHSCSSFILHDAFSIVQPDHLWKKIFERAREISIISNMKLKNYKFIDHGML